MMWRIPLLMLPFGLFVVGFAASLSLTSATLGAAQVAIPRCATGALTVLPNLNGSANIVSVTVSGIPAACGGGTMKLTVNNGTTNSSGSAAVPGAGGSLTVTLAAGVPLTAAEQTDLVVIGP